MNTYWYIYMRTRNSELGRLLGEHYVKKNYKVMAEESAYLYQKQAWGALVRALEIEELRGVVGEEKIRALAEEKMAGFMDRIDEVWQRHRGFYSIPDLDLREQIREATVKLVVPAYAKFLKSYSSVLQVKSCQSPEEIEGWLCRIFEEGGGDRRRDGKVSLRRRDSKDRSEERYAESTEQSRGNRDFRRSKSNTSDA